jgi:hypothetical protein
LADKKRFQRSKKFYIVSGILLVILIAGILFWRNYKYKLVDQKLDKLVTEKSRGLYQVIYEHLQIDEALGNLSAEHVEMIPDSSVYQSMIGSKTAPDNLFYIHIPILRITGVKTPRALLNKEIDAHIIRIENAQIEIRLRKSDKKNKPDFFKKMMAPEMYRQLLGTLNSIHADSVILENATLTLVDNQSKKIQIKITGLSIRFAGIAIDSLNQNDSTRILFSRELAVHCNQVEWPTKDQVYTLTVNSFDFNSQTGSLHTAEIRLIPHLSETAFAKSYKYAKDRIAFRIGKLDILGINRQAYLKEELIVDSLLLTDALIHIFRDKSVAHDTVDRTNNFPQVAIMRLPFPIYIKKIIFRDGYIEYKEKNDQSDSSGKVAFFHVHAVLDNVTNMQKYIRLNNQIRLHFKSDFLNETVFTADIQMRLNDSKGNFQLDARMGSLPAISLNPLLKPMALAELKRGRIKGLHYQMEATNKHAKGTLNLTYDDVAIKLLKKDDNKNKYKTKFFPSLAAGVLFKESNPLHGETRIGNVDYDRDIHRSIFNLMWKSLFSGIKKVAL